MRLTKPPGTVAFCGVFGAKGDCPRDCPPLGGALVRGLPTANRPGLAFAIIPIIVTADDSQTSRRPQKWIVPERWLSGRKRRIANPVCRETGISGSNPDLSAFPRRKCTKTPAKQGFFVARSR